MWSIPIHIYLFRSCDIIIYWMCKDTMPQFDNANVHKVPAFYIVFLKL